MVRKRNNTSRSRTDTITVAGMKNTYEIDAYETYTLEWYGQDADGNRGVQRWEPDDLIIVEIRLNGKAIPEASIPPRIMALLNDKISDHNFEPGGN